MTDISQKWLEKSKNKELEILSIFANNYSVKMRESEIVNKIKMPQRTVSRKLNHLAQKGILQYVREGKNKIYSLNKENPGLFSILMWIESYKSVKFLAANPKLAILLKEVNIDSLIFGSYAKSSYSKDSDLDLVFFHNKRKDIIKKANMEIHPQYSSFSDLKNRLKHKDALASEIVNNHIILRGYEKIIRLFMEHCYG